MKKTLLITMVVLLVFSSGISTVLGVPDDFLLKEESEGEHVFMVQMRLRDLGYLNYRPTGRYLKMTVNAVRAFQEQNGLDADGRIGKKTYDVLFSSEAVRKPLGKGISGKSGPSLDGTATATGELADWATVDAAFGVGKTATVIDYNSDKSFDVKRTGGVGHAKIEAVDSAAYAVFLECFGGEPNWEKRSVLVKVGSAVYAGSLFGNPDGESTITANDMDGSTSLYFYGSTSDVLGFEDKEHLKWVLRAAGEQMKYR